MAFALRLKLPLAAWLFLMNLLIVLGLSGLAWLSDQPVPLRWIEGMINTVSWLVFAFGARVLYQNARLNFGLGAPAYLCPTAIAI